MASRESKLQRQRLQPKSKRRNGTSPFLAAVALLIAVSLFAGGFYLGFRKGVAVRRRASNILLVNAEHPLSPDYVPDELVCLYEMKHAFRLSRSNISLTASTSLAAQEMFKAAEDDNVNGFYITSGYRSYERQAEVFAESREGYAQKPGCSEHQTGLCFDVTAENSGGFENTPQYAWLRQNAHKYGFIQRYPANKAQITGISYEPWHYRYVGVEAATEMYKNNLTLEEYLN